MLDIGCGTGLLSMLAVKTGAEEVYGCELYEPLAKIAREVTELNCQGKIKVLPLVLHPPRFRRNSFASHVGESHQD